MRDLSAVRRGWEEVERTEAGLPHQMSSQGSLRQWLEMQQVFERQLRDTEALFGPERQLALAELQSRLRRLAEWQERYGEPGSVHSEAPTASAGS